MADPTQLKPPTDYTKFPSLLTEVDKLRLTDLKKQKSQMEQLYQTKFNPISWSKTNSVEKAVRQWIEPTLLAKPVELLTPPELGFDFGWTPETFKTESLKVATEYKELTRKQQVSSVLPLMMETLRNQALSKESIITNITDLNTIFKLDELGFTEEDKGYFTQFAQDLLKATPEQLLSGNPWAIRPVTDEEMLYLRNAQQQGIDPRLITSTVAFSKNQDEINQALQQAYPPKTDISDDTRAEAISKAYADKLQELGITKGAKVSDAALEAFTKLADEAGSIITLTDDETGISSIARVKKDNTIWTDSEVDGQVVRRLEGYLDPNTQIIVPIGIQGQPLIDQASRESAGKDLWDTYILASNQAGHLTEKALTQTLPDAFLALSQKTLKAGEFLGRKEAREESIRQMAEWRQRFKNRQEQSNLEFQDWQKQHPELAPRPEVLTPPTKFSDWVDPYRVAYTLISNAPIVATAFAIGAATTILTGGNFGAGAWAAAGVMTPTMIQSNVDDAVANGAEFEDATVIGTGVGILQGLVERISWGVFGKIMQPALMKLLRKEIGKEGTKQITKNLIAKGVISQGTKGALTKAGQAALIIGITEQIEENTQNILQNAYVKLYNENRSLFDNTLETVYGTFWNAGIFAAMGGGATYLSLKSNLPQAVQEKMTTIEEQAVEAGIPIKQAQDIALGKVMESELGQAQVELAQNKVLMDLTPVNTIQDINPEDITTNQAGELVYTNKATGIKFTGKTWDELNAKITAATNRVSPQNLKMVGDNFVYTDPQTGQVTTAKTITELNKLLSDKSNIPSEGKTVTQGVTPAPEVTIVNAKDVLDLFPDSYTSDIKVVVDKTLPLGIEVQWQPIEWHYLPPIPKNWSKEQKSLFVELMDDTYAKVVSDPQRLNQYPEIKEFFKSVGLIKEIQEAVKPVVDPVVRQERITFLQNRIRENNELITTNINSLEGAEGVIGLRAKLKKAGFGDEKADIQDSIQRREESIAAIKIDNALRQKELDQILSIKTIEEVQQVGNVEIHDDGKGGKIICG